MVSTVRETLFSSTMNPVQLQLLHFTSLTLLTTSLLLNPCIPMARASVAAPVGALFMLAYRTFLPSFRLRRPQLLNLNA